jgi:hypothetical protein
MLLNDIMEDEMGGAYRMHGKCLENVNRKTERKRTLVTLSQTERNAKVDFKKNRPMTVWTRFYWIRTGTSGGLF